MPGELPEKTWMSEEIVSGVQPRGDRDFRHREIEAAAAMADIEQHAALLGRERRRQQLAVLHDVGEGAGHVRRAGIGVGQDIARPQQIEDVATSTLWSRRRRYAPSSRAGQPHISQAWMPRFSGSSPCLKMTFSDIRTLTPSRKSGFSASAIAQASIWALSML